MRIGRVLWVWVAGLVVAAAAVGAGAQPLAISYQGVLEDGGAPAEGTYDLRFTLYDAATGGVWHGLVERPGVAVSGGVFSVELDFGLEAFRDGGERWMEVAARPAGDGAYTVLSPRSRITSTPYAVRAAFAGEAGVAAWAADGPFAPADNTPPSASGLPGGSAVATELSWNGGTPAPVGVLYPVSMERTVSFGGGGGGTPQPGPLMGARVTVYRARTDANWRNAFETGNPGFELTLRVQAPNGAQTTYTFKDARAVEYRIEAGSDGGPMEVIELFAPAASVDRERMGSAPGVSAPVAGGAPLGASGSPGTLALAWNGTAPELSGLGVPPREARPVNPVSGLPTGPVVSDNIGVLSSTLAAQTLWEAFRTGQSRPFEVRLLPQGSVVWTVNTAGLLMRWELRQADDGLPYEYYELTYRRPNGGGA